MFKEWFKEVIEDMNNKGLVPVVAVGLLIIVIGSIIEYKHNTSMVDHFNNSETLVCVDLIVTNSNWKLVGNHLVNNNVAGYINIGDCRVK